MPTGVAGQLPDNLSDYMKVGRSQRPGPVTGVIECFTHSSAFIATASSVKTRSMRFISGRYKILAVTWYSRASTGTPNFRVDANTAVLPFTANTNIKVSIDMGAIPNGIERSSDLVTSDIDGDATPWLNININMGAATLTDFVATIWYIREGHINADVVDD